MSGANIKPSPETITAGGRITLTATPEKLDPSVIFRVFHWQVSGGKLGQPAPDVPPITQLPAAQGSSATAYWDTTGLTAGSYRALVSIFEYGGPEPMRQLLRSLTGDAEVTVTAPPVVVAPEPSSAGGQWPQRETSPAAGPVLARLPTRTTALPVALQRHEFPQTPDEVLWMVIRRSTNNLSFSQYVAFIDKYLGTPGKSLTDVASARPGSSGAVSASRNLAMPFPGVDSYRRLKVATEIFVLVNTGIYTDFDRLLSSLHMGQEEDRREGPLTNPRPHDGKDIFENLWERYLVNVNGHKNAAIPYMAIIRDRLPDVPLVTPKEVGEDELAASYGILLRKLGAPNFMELIWSYWHEEGMLIQTMAHITQRFQNVRAAGDRDPLANLEMDPLRPISNLLWGYIQDEQHRLSVQRRAYEYDHEYGITLQGKAVTGMRSADRRTKFMECFHHLLYRCVQFYRQDDDTTVVADGFPVLNAIKELNYLLAYGAQNQFGDLPSTARQEMLLQQWLLGRPEMREFLGGRVMVPYPEPWMDRVDSMKTLQGWTDVSVVHFHDMAVFGEQVLLSARYGAWSLSNDPYQAANWARYWRPEIQGYIHAYRAVTGVDLSADVVDSQMQAERNAAPSYHLRNRLAQQQRK